MAVITEYTNLIVMLLLLFCGVLMYKLVEWIGTVVEAAGERTRAQTLENDKRELENSTIEISNARLELENEKLELEIAQLKQAA